MLHTTKSCPDVAVMLGEKSNVAASVSCVFLRKHEGKLTCKLGFADNAWALLTSAYVMNSDFSLHLQQRLSNVP